MFENKIGKTVEVYVDDMLVKSKIEGDHVRDLREMFAILREYNMKLNPDKCAFGVEKGKFLGFIVNQRKIKANTDKIRTLFDMRSPIKIKEVQRLTGRVAALNRFIAKATDNASLSFKLLKRKKGDIWDRIAKRLFKNLKRIWKLPYYF